MSDARVPVQFSTRELTLSDETAGTVDTSRVELHEFEVLQRKTCTSNHGVTVTRASVRTRATEVCATVTASSEHSLVRTEPVKCTVLHVQRDDTHTLAVLHDQVEREVLDKEVGVVTEGLAVQGVEERVAGTVGSSSTTVCLTTLAELQRLTTKRTLVDLALLSS